MRYIGQHIKAIIDQYRGEVPLAHYLKNYFRQHPILGSRDRKILSAMAYSWYRCFRGIGNWGLGIGMEEQVSVCMRLCRNEQLLPPGFAGNETVGISFDANALFPFEVELSGGIDKEEWLKSMLVQPNLFIRIRKDKGKVMSLLNTKEIPYTFVTDNCLSLPNGAKIDSILPEDTYVVQDASSQQTGMFFNPKKNELWYDCCSGAGGKSLLLKDLEPGVRLTVSDRRESIIHNLQARFKLYRHILPVAHVTDVADSAKLEKALGGKLFDHIICDAPCSGSGTWARTPEQLYFFDAETIGTFAALQQTIAVNVSRYLKPGGRLIYITCSVFKKENEDVVDSIVGISVLQLVRRQLINGIQLQADSMFVAVLEKN